MEFKNNCHLRAAYSSMNLTWVAMNSVFWGQCTAYVICCPKGSPWSHKFMLDIIGFKLNKVLSLKIFFKKNLVPLKSLINEVC